MTFKYQQQFVLIYHSHITIFTIREYKKQTFLLYISHLWMDDVDVVYIGLFFSLEANEKWEKLDRAE